MQYRDIFVHFKEINVYTYFLHDVLKIDPACNYYAIRRIWKWTLADNKIVC